MGEALVPDEVTEALRITPSECHQSGDPRQAPPGRTYAPYREGLWRLSSGVADEADLDAHLDDLLTRLGGARAALDRLKTAGFKQDIFIGVFSGGGNSEFRISRRNLARIQQLGVELDFDIYG